METDKKAEEKKGDSNAKALTPLDRAFAPLTKLEVRLGQLLEGTGLTTTRFLAQLRFALAKNPALQGCTPTSLMGAALEAADLGLDPSGRAGSAWMIPFKGQVTLVPGYRGLIDLAHRSGFVRGVNAFLVYDNDKFKMQLGRMPEHEPFLPKKADEKRGDWYAAWAIARLAGGGYVVDFMTRLEIEAIRNRSPGYRSKGSPWHSDPEEMARKTMLRRLIKKLPISPVSRLDKLVRATELDDGGIIVHGHTDGTRYDETVDADFQDIGEDEKAESAVDAVAAKL